MNHVIEIPRLQMQWSSLEDSIDQETPVRFVPDHPLEPVFQKPFKWESRV